MLDRTKDDAGFVQLKQGRARAALTGMLWAGLTSLLPSVVSAGVFALASRYLTPSEFGLVALAGSIALLAGALTPAGFGFALVQREDIRKSHFDAVFLLCLSFGAATYLLLFLLAPLLARLFHSEELTPLLRVMGLRVLFDMAGVVPQAILARSMQFKKLAMRTTIATLISAAVCLAFLVQGYGFWALALSQLVSASAATLASLFSVSWRPRLSLDRSAIAELARYGVFASGHKVLQTVNFDQMLLGAFLGTHALGLYGFSRRIFQLFNDLIAGSLNSVSYPLLSSLQSEPEKLKRAFLLACFASSILSFPLFMGLAAVGDEMVPLIFGQQWTEAVPALWAFCLVGLLSCVGILQASLITSRGFMDWWVYYQLVQQGTTAALILVLYPYGVSVLAFAIAAKTWLTFPFTVVKTGRILGIGAVELVKPLLLPAAGCIVMVAGVFLVRSSMPDSAPHMRLATEIVAGAFLYAATVLAFGSRRLLEFKTFLADRRRTS